MGNPQSTIRNPKSEGGLELISGSIEETQAIGERIGRLLRPGDVVALFGELGTGKTTLIQGLARGLGRDPEAVKSPTFVLMREYPPGPPFTSAGAGHGPPGAKAARPGDHYGRAGGAGPGPPITTAARPGDNYGRAGGAGVEAPLVHIDGYRLADARAVSWLDLDLVFSPRKITVIEWAERFAGVLPEDRLEVRLSHVSANRRRLVLVPSGPRAKEVIEQFQQSAISAIQRGGPANPVGGRNLRHTAWRTRQSCWRAHSAISATKVDDATARD